MRGAKDEAGAALGEAAEGGWGKAGLRPLPMRAPSDREHTEEAVALHPGAQGKHHIAPRHRQRRTCAAAASGAERGEYDLPALWTERLHRVRRPDAHAAR